MITENFVIKSGVTTAIASIVGAAELTQVTGIELSLVLWLVGGLLAVIATLLAAICYFIKDMRASNSRQHNELFNAQRGVLDRLAHLEGEHDSAFQLQGCAYDPTKLKKMIVEVLHEKININ